MDPELLQLSEDLRPDLGAVADVDTGDAVVPLAPVVARHKHGLAVDEEELRQGALLIASICSNLCFTIS